MKIACTTAGDSLDALLDSRFGRAPRFLIYDLDTETFELIDNQLNLNAAQGAGIQSARHIEESGAKAVITGHCGPKAFRILKECGIAVYHAEEKPLRMVIEEFKTGSLKAATGSDVEAHWV